MKIIKVSTDLKIEECDFLKMNYQEQLKIVNNLIGNGCSTYEIVYPVRLYTELGMSNNPDIEPNKSVCMLVDEEGLSKGIDINIVGSYLYRTDLHGNPIAGNVVFAGLTRRDGVLQISALQDDIEKELMLKLTYLIISFNWLLNP
ncbi:DUF3846 domain-containing protein [Roseburia sp. CLA-AA-H204]|uniref:DUF3846 domain-containing protein n=1 Tax=Roseburia amylophila TaxID=2981794 RepID=A0AAW4WIJ2_9FIRM|nr:DUF3846 domain-containing protein [Roseburia amylophila]MCC2242575.1 DUF3846 domain-containing protein [Roseburia amylophila]